MEDFMTMKKAILSTVALGALVALAPAVASAATVLKIGFATINDGQHKSALWIEEVEKRTGGSIDVQVYPAAQPENSTPDRRGAARTQEAFIASGFFKGRTRLLRRLTLLDCSTVSRIRQRR